MEIEVVADKVDKLSISAKKSYCCKNICFLSPSDYKDIGIFIKQMNLMNLIIDCPTGCRIDLDKISDDIIINQLYNIIHSRIIKLEK